MAVVNDQVAWERLALAICKQAADDYRELKTRPKPNKNTIAEIKSLEKWFSDGCDGIADYFDCDGFTIAERLMRESDGEL